MSKPVVGIASFLILAALVFAAFGSAYADAGGPPTPTSPPPPTPTQTLPFPTATATWIPYPYPISDLSAEEQAVSAEEGQGQISGTALVVTLEADMTFSSGSQPQSQASQEEGGFPLWPVILVLGLGLVLVVGIVGYFVLVRR